MIAYQYLTTIECYYSGVCDLELILANILKDLISVCLYRNYLRPTLYKLATVFLSSKRMHVIESGIIKPLVFEKGHDTVLMMYLCQILVSWMLIKKLIYQGYDTNA